MKRSGFALLLRAAVLGAGVVGALSLGAATVGGSATERASDILHPNGNIYDQVLLTGASATVGADPGEVVRVSFVDLNDDIIQVEFSGAGSLTIVLAVDGLSGPAIATKYHQPDVLYMKGHAAITIQGSDTSTHLTIFSVGPLTALNHALFRLDETYDGIADLAKITIVADPGSNSGSTFGSIRAGNAEFWDVKALVGIAAANVQVQGPVVVSDISALESAVPALIFGTESTFPALIIAGGDLEQPNKKQISAVGGYVFTPSMQPGVTSHNVPLPAQPLRGEFNFGFFPSF